MRSKEDLEDGEITEEELIPLRIKDSNARTRRMMSADHYLIDNRDSHVTHTHTRNHPNMFESFRKRSEISPIFGSACDPLFGSSDTDLRITQTTTASTDNNNRFNDYDLRRNQTSGNFVSNNNNLCKINSMNACHQSISDELSHLRQQSIVRNNLSSFHINTANSDSTLENHSINRLMNTATQPSMQFIANQSIYDSSLAPTFQPNYNLFLNSNQNYLPVNSGQSNSEFEKQIKAHSETNNLNVNPLSTYLNMLAVNNNNALKQQLLCSENSAPHMKEVKDKTVVLGLEEIEEVNMIDESPYDPEEDIIVISPDSPPDTNPNILQIATKREKQFHKIDIFKQNNTTLTDNLKNLKTIDSSIPLLGEANNSKLTQFENIDRINGNSSANVDKRERLNRLLRINNENKTNYKKYPKHVKKSNDKKVISKKIKSKSCVKNKSKCMHKGLKVPKSHKNVSRRCLKRLNKQNILTITDTNESKPLLNKTMDDASYEDLLEEYKRIQFQLKELEQEEHQRDIIVITDEDKQVESNDRQSFEVCDISMKSDHIVVSDDSDDNDDNEFELRRLALESKKNKTKEETETALSNNENEKIIEDDIDDIDENALREQLLKSLFSHKSNTTNETDKSPEIFENIESNATITQTEELNNEQKQSEIQGETNKCDENISANNLKTKLIINFGDDSSEDEQQLENRKSNRKVVNPCAENSPVFSLGLDSLLKQARLKSVTPSISTQSFAGENKRTAVGKLYSLTRQIEYKQLKAEIARREKDQVSESTLKLNENKWMILKAKLDEKKTKIDLLKMKVTAKRTAMRKAQQHARKMQEAFIAATRVVKSATSEFHSLNLGLKTVEKSYGFEQNNIKQVESQCIRIGLKLKGNTYKLPISATLKRVAKVSFSTRLKTEQEIANEKKRLQELERIYSQKLQSLKNNSITKPASIQSTVQKPQTPNTSDAEINKDSIPASKIDEAKHLLNALIKQYTQCTQFNLLKSQNCFTEMIFLDRDFQPLNSDVFVPPIDDNKLLVDPLINVHSSADSVLFHLNAYKFVDNNCHDISCDHWTNNVNPHDIICPYDLLGTCNDEKCIRQHFRNCILDAPNKLADLLLYQPKLADLASDKSINMSNDVKRQKLLQYSKNLLNINPNLSVEDQSRKIANNIKKAAKEIKLTASLLTRHIPKSFVCSPSEIPLDDLSYRFNIKDKSLLLNQAKISQLRLSADPDIYFKNRFYAPEGVPISAELETSLSSDPHNIQLWIKLAYYHVTKCSNRTTEYIDRALNVLSRALEHNKTNPELYEHYLFIYSNRVTRIGEDSRFSLMNICRKMVQHCSHYRIWIRYLSLCTNLRDKQTVSYDLLNALINNNIINDNNFDLRSHQILEVLMYKIQLNLQLNYFNLALALLNRALNNVSEPNNNDISMESESSQNSVFCNISDKLTVSDRVFAWLCYVHLIIFRNLPPHCFDLFKQGFTEIIDKNGFIFDWKRLIGLFDVEQVRNCLQNALHSFSSESDSESTIDIISPLYINMIELYFCDNKELTKSYLEKFINTPVINSHLYPLMAEYRFELSGVYTDLIETLKDCPLYSACDLKISYFVTKNYFEANDLMSAKNELLRIVNSFYFCPIYYSQLKDALQTLIFENEENNCNYELIKNRRSKESNSVFLWLCYILVMKMGETNEREMDSAFQCALALCSSSIDLHLLWWNYLKFMASNVSTQTQFLNLFELVRHCCVTVCDPLFQIQVVNYFCKILVNNENVLNALIHFVKLIPENIYIVMKSISFLMENNNKETCLSLIHFIVFEKKMRFLYVDFWKISIALAIEKQDHILVHKLLQLSLSLMPYSNTLWEMLKLYETNIKHSEHLKQAESVCENQLNILWKNIAIKL